MTAIIRVHAETSSPTGFCGLIGSHPLMLRLFDDIRAVAAVPVPVLVQGATGTGKELVVQALHELSRAQGRLVSVNLAALPEALAECELFGSIRGAFTGATDRCGLIEEADGGTLYLDEAGDATPAIQAKLLRVIESGVFRRMGCRRERRVSVRIIVSVQQPVVQLVAKGLWRNDFYFRVAGGMLNLPALRDRAEDIPDLVNHFLVALRQPPVALLDLHVLKVHAWPGNVRELKRVVERAVCVAGGRVVGPDHLMSQLSTLPGSPVHHSSETVSARDTGRRRNELAELMARYQGDMVKAAEILGLSRSGLYYRLRQLGIPTPRRPRIPVIPAAIPAD